MSWLIRWSLAHPWLVIVVASLACVGGGFLVHDLPVDVFPDLDRPGVTVMTHVPGLSPDETEAKLTLPIETAIHELPGVDAVWSSSSIGLSHVHVVFGWNADVDAKRREVQARLATVQPQLPPGASPVLLPFVSVMGEIELIGLSGAAPEVLRRAADDLLRPRLMEIHGVAQVLVIGGDVQELAVLADPRAMAAHRVSLAQVRAAAAHAGQVGIGGILPYDNQEYLIRVLAPAKAANLASLVVAPGVLLGDVAAIEPRAILKRGSAGLDGGRGVILSVYKAPLEDSRRLSAEIGAALEATRNVLPSGVSARRIFRQADFIQASITGVVGALREGGFLVLLVVLVFLASLRASAITLTALPVSFLLAMVLVWRFGLTLNTMTLGGLALAVGQLVDDAVVDVENVWRRLRERLPRGADPVQVVADASLEIRGSILYATLVVVLSVLPVAMLSGVEGRFFQPLVLAYIIAVGLSLVVAMTLTPALCVLLLPRSHGLSSNAVDAFVPRVLKPPMRRLLTAVLERPWLPLLVAALLCAVAVLALSRRPRELLPPFNEGTLTINLAAVPGITLADSDKLGALAEQLILEVPEVVDTGRRTGRAELDTHSAGVHQSEIEVALREGRPRADIEADLRARLATLPGLSVYIGQPISHRLEHLLEGVNGQIIVRLFGDDPVRLRELGESVRRAMVGVSGIVDLQAEKQLDIPELLVEVDPARASAASVNPGDVAQQAQDAIYGAVVGKVELEGRPVDLRVRADDAALASPEALGALPIAGGPAVVPLSQVAVLREAAGLDYLNRDGGRRVFLVMANVQGRDAWSAAKEVQAAVAQQLKLPKGYSVVYGGEWAAAKAAQAHILWFSALALVAVALALLLHFRTPALVLLTLANIPLSLVGSVTALALFDEKLSVAAALGFVAVCGIASRNTILLLGHYQHLMAREGESFGKSLVIRGSLERLTPMLMTALTAGLALIPWIAERHAPGREILGPVALVIAGGLISSTLLDLLVTPAAFYLWGGNASPPPPHLSVR